MQSTLSSTQAFDYLLSVKQLATIKAPTLKVAGFRTTEGLELALVLANKTPTLYLSPGPWLANWDRGDLKVEEYAERDSRNHHLDANAPALARGKPMLQVMISTPDELESLLTAYLGRGPELRPISPTGADSVLTSRPMIQEPLNQILCGPPGTGKTYETVNAALRILDPVFLEEYAGNRAALTRRFRELCDAHRIRFVTFHQSFSYEDFVEGLRAEVDEASGQVRYEVTDGVFKEICQAAAARVSSRKPSAIEVGIRRIWKMSLGNTQGPDADVYDECVSNGYALLGYGGGIDFSGCANRVEVAKRFEEKGMPLAKPAADYAATSVNLFINQMKAGDLIVISDGNTKLRAVGLLTGEYQFEEHSRYDGDYSQRRAVDWLLTASPSLPHTEVMNNRFSQMTLYELKSNAIDRGKLQALLDAHEPSSSGAGRPFAVGEMLGSQKGYEVLYVSDDLVELRKPRGNILPVSIRMLDALARALSQGRASIDDVRDGSIIEKVPEEGFEPNLVKAYVNILPDVLEKYLEWQGSAKPRPGDPAASDARVLIIDEINRGNVSRIFGELITLIEPSKRAGAPEALEVTLPYSRETFSVPSNVYLVGTMNTADRSLTGLDVALRRRFVFREMPPRPDLLQGLEVEGVDVAEMLRVLNMRIEALLDREHCLGHAYFLPLRDQPSLELLAQIFREQVVPLLQEYFFDDWQRIQWVLNDHRKAVPYRFVTATGGDAVALFGPEAGVPRQDPGWAIQASAFELQASYSGILDSQPAQ